MRPLELPNFETQARRLRYQALGAACSAGRFTQLLLAHHADDQAETALTRLSSGHKGISLRGMDPFTSIPECWGIHGVHKSGAHEIERCDRNNSALRVGHVYWDRPGREVDVRLSSSPLIERGGIQVLRPLLEFCKQELIDTCQAHGVAWSEDATNKDTWRTPRNAIRYILGTSRLPEALTITSLVQLSSKMQMRSRDHRRLSRWLTKLCQILTLDLRSGSVTFRFPKCLLHEINVVAASQGGSHVSESLTVLLLVQSLVKLVTPYEDVPLRSLKRAVMAMFPDLVQEEHTHISESTNDTTFTAAGVLFQRITLPWLNNDARSSSVITPSGRTSENRDLDTDYAWRLTRERFRRVSADEEPEIRLNAPNEILFDGPVGDWSSWHLWDGRYWIRIKNSTNKSIKVRPFKKSDLQDIRTRIRQTARKSLKDVLGEAAPQKVRWTLPVIVYETQDDTSTGQVLALPTLGRTGMIDAEDKKGDNIRDWQIEWEIRYKFVDLDAEGEHGAGMKPDTILSWEDP